MDFYVKGICFPFLIQLFLSVINFYHREFKDIYNSLRKTICFGWNFHKFEHSEIFKNSWYCCQVNKWLVLQFVNSNRDAFIEK